MKDSLSSVDVRFLVGELGEELVGGRVDSVYEAGERTLVFDVFKSGAGKKIFVVAPNYFCISSARRTKPKEPSSFVMQLRKNLKGCFVRKVGQIGFERIIEIEFEGKDSSHTLICEFFSRGNIILCDREKKILGLMEWQRWRDRKLGVGQTYVLPPPKPDPISFSEGAFEKILKKSDKDAVRTLVAGVGLPGDYSEEVLANSGVEKKTAAANLSKKQSAALYASLKKTLSEIGSGKKDPRIVYEGGSPVDVTPQPLTKYSGLETKSFRSYVSACDEYFTGLDERLQSSKEGERYLKKKKKLEDIKSRQEKALADQKDKAQRYQLFGDLIYGHLTELEEITAAIKKARGAGLSDTEILEKFRAGARYGIPAARCVKDIKKQKIVLDLD